MYETDLTAFQWQVIQAILPSTRRCKHLLRLIVRAMLCWVKSGCQWPLFHATSRPMRWAIAISGAGCWLIAAACCWRPMSGLLTENDRVGGQAALEKPRQLGFKRLRAVLADAGYAGQRWAEWTRRRCGWYLETTPVLSGRSGFTPVPTRRVVERTSSWVHWHRRLSRDYECKTSSTEATRY